jgi:hypothetical protein
MTMPAGQRASSFLDEFGSPDRTFLEHRPFWKKAVSVLAIMFGCGFSLLGLLFLFVVLCPSEARPPMEAAEQVVGYCLSAILWGLAVLLFYAPIRRWWTGSNGCALYADKFVTFNRRRWRCVPYRNLVRVENRLRGVKVTTADGATLRISKGVEDRQTLYRLLQQAIPQPVETIQTEPVDTIHMAPMDTIQAQAAETIATPAETDRRLTDSADAPVSVPTRSRANSSSRDRAPSSQLAASNRSAENGSFKYHDPLRRFHLALYGGVLIIAAIYMHGAFAELASGERESVQLWIGFAFLYDLLGPTLTVWGSGIAGATLVAVGIIRGLGGPEKEPRAGQTDPLSSGAFWDAGGQSPHADPYHRG